MPDYPGRAHFDRLYATLIEELADGPLRPGEHIDVRALARTLHVSTTPLREALSRLVGLGLVEQHLMQGFSLAPLDARDVAVLYRLRALCVDLCMFSTQEAALREAARMASDDDQLFARIVALHGERVLDAAYKGLAARIRLLRRCEDAIFADRLTLPQAMAVEPTRAAMRLLLRQHQRRRWQHAADLALMRGRQ